MTWTEDRVAILREMYAAGFTASRIAERIGGGVTRNAVIGKAIRLGLPRRGPSPPHQRRGASRRKLAAPVFSSQRGRDHRGHLEALPLPSPAETDIPRVSLLDASDRACR